MEEEEENNKWRAMNGRDGHWELNNPQERETRGASWPRCRRGEELGQGINTEYKDEYEVLRTEYGV